jgi:hypothetical protein
MPTTKLLRMPEVKRTRRPNDGRATKAKLRHAVREILVLAPPPLEHLVISIQPLHVGSVH